MANFANLAGITYCGTESRDILSKAFYTPSLQAAGYTVIPNVKDRHKLYKGEVGKNLWQAYTCPWTPQGEASMSEQYITADAIKVEMEQCYDPFWTTYFGEQMKIAVTNGDIASIDQLEATLGDRDNNSFLEWVVGKLVEQAGRERMEMIYRGDKDNAAYSGTSAYLKLVNGFEKELKSNTAVTQVTITGTSVVDDVKAVVAAGLAKAALNDAPVDDYTIQLNYADVKKLITELGELCACNLTINTFANWTNVNNDLQYSGFRVIATKQTAGTIIFGPAANMTIATDLVGSENEIRIANAAAILGGNMFKFQMISNLGTAIVFPELFTYGQPAQP
jgi:hypothetical protein